MDELNGTKLFSKIYLRSGYHQIRMREDYIQKTTFHCHIGHFEFFFMPFALNNDLKKFQSCMNKVFSENLCKYFLVFFDDILIYSRTWEENLLNLDVVVTILVDQSFYSKLSKWDFDMTELLYLVHVMFQEEVKVHQEKIESILGFLSPRNLIELRGFIGLCNYYRISKGYSQFTAPLTDMTKKGAFNWNGEDE